MPTSTIRAAIFGAAGAPTAAGDQHQLAVQRHRGQAAPAAAPVAAPGLGYFCR